VGTLFAELELAAALLRQHRYREAEPTVRDAVRGFRLQAHAEAYLAGALITEATILESTGRSGGMTLVREASRLVEGLPPAQACDVAASQSDIAKWLEGARRHAEAAAMAARALTAARTGCAEGTANRKGVESMVAGILGTGQR